jgi:hypothetical protein
LNKGLLERNPPNQKMVLARRGNVLGRFPSIGYGLIYLMLIPIFAILYLSLGDQFYHSTVKYEEYLRGDRDRLSQAMQTAIAESYRERHGDSWESKDGWKLKIDEMRVSELTVNDDLYTLVLALNFENHRPTGEKIQGIPVGSSYSFDWYRMTFSVRAPIGNSSGTSDYLICPESSAQQASLEIYIPFEELFPLRHGFYSGPGKCGSLLASQEVTKQLIAYSRAMKGFPSAASGSFDRMLYLSATTITTLGYGDIVPITPKARMCVAAEAISGIVLIGLFLNALVTEIRRPPEE